MNSKAEQDMKQTKNFALLQKAGDLLKRYVNPQETSNLEELLNEFCGMPIKLRMQQLDTLFKNKKFNEGLPDLRLVELLYCQHRGINPNQLVDYVPNLLLMAHEVDGTLVTRLAHRMLTGKHDDKGEKTGYIYPDASLSRINEKHYAADCCLGALRLAREQGSITYLFLSRWQLIFVPLLGSRGRLQFEQGEIGEILDIMSELRTDAVPSILAAAIPGMVIFAGLGSNRFCSSEFGRSLRDFIPSADTRVQTATAQESSKGGAASRDMPAHAGNPINQVSSLTPPVFAPNERLTDADPSQGRAESLPTGRGEVSAKLSTEQIELVQRLQDLFKAMNAQLISNEVDAKRLFLDGARFEARLQDTQEKLKSVQDELNGCQADAEIFRDAKRKAVAELQSEVESWNRERTRLVDAKDAAEMERNNLQTQNETLCKEAEQLRRDLEVSSGDLDSLNEKKDDEWRIALREKLLPHLEKLKSHWGKMSTEQPDNKRVERLGISLRNLVSDFTRLADLDSES